MNDNQVETNVVAKPMPKMGDVFTHNSNEKTYVVVSTGMMKDENASWIPCVTYSRPEETDVYFTRGTDAFMEKFTLGTK